MLNENGISYTRDHKKAQKFGYTRFTYSWFYSHFLSKSGKHFVYCSCRNDALELVNFWSGSSWSYRLLYS